MMTLQTLRTPPIVEAVLDIECDFAPGHHITTVLAAGNVEDGKLPVIFDNTVAAQIEGDPADWSALEATIQSLRSLKNRIFSETLTAKCLSLFQ